MLTIGNPRSCVLSGVCHSFFRKHGTGPRIPDYIHFFCAGRIPLQYIHKILHILSRNQIYQSCACLAVAVVLGREYFLSCFLFERLAVYKVPDRVLLKLLPRRDDFLSTRLKRYLSTSPTVSRKSYFVYSLVRSPSVGVRSGKTVEVLLQQMLQNCHRIAGQSRLFCPVSVTVN